MFGILGWIVFGLIVGILAKFLMPGRDPGGFVITALIGIAGAIIGGGIGRVGGPYGPGGADGRNQLGRHERMESDASVLIVDEDESCREELARILGIHGYRVLEAETGDAALALARDRHLAAAILEIPLQGLSGYELCQQIKAENGPEVAVIFLTGARTEPYDRVAGLLLGADDYLVKPFLPGELVTRLDRFIGQRGARPAGGANLTKREHEILELLGHGLPHAEIAGRLFISPKTVATHVEHILRKFGVRSRTQAVAVAYRQRILRPAAAPPEPANAALSRS